MTSKIQSNGSAGNNNKFTSASAFNSPLSTNMSDDALSSSSKTSSTHALSTTSFISHNHLPPHLQAIETHNVQQIHTTSLPLSNATAYSVVSVSADTEEGEGGVNGGSVEQLEQRSPLPAVHSDTVGESEKTNEGFRGAEAGGFQAPAPLDLGVEQEPPLVSTTTVSESSPFTPSTVVGMGDSDAFYPVTGSRQPLSSTSTKGQPHHIYSRKAESETVSSDQYHEHTTYPNMNGDAPHRLSTGSNRLPRYNSLQPTNTGVMNSAKAAAVIPAAMGGGGSHRQHLGSQGMDLTYSNTSDDSRTQHLPTLWQVLHRKTSPPVCLFNFYLYMRDYEKSSAEVDFWLDVTAHELLWRLYVRATKRRWAQGKAEREEKSAAERERQERTAQLEVEGQDHGAESSEKAHVKKPSVTLEMYEPHWSAANRYLELSESGSEPHSKDVSAVELVCGLDEQEREEYDQPEHTQEDRIIHSEKSSEPILLHHACPISQKSQGVGSVSHIPGAIPENWRYSNHPHHSTSTDTRKPSVTGDRVPTAGTTLKNSNSNSSSKRASNPNSASVTKEDLQKSAERIYCKYLIPQAATPVRIPDSVRRRVALVMDNRMMISVSGSGTVAAVASSRDKSAVDTFSSPTPSAMISSTLPAGSSEKSSRPRELQSKSDSQHPHRQSSHSLQQPEQDVGLVFAEAREIVFDGMESYYFPRFLDARAHGNMVHSHRIARAVLGLFILFVGFVIVLCLIFLNRPRRLRAWALIPIFLGILLCTMFQFNICPIMAALGVSETSWMRFAKIKEQHILTLHQKRAIKVLIVAVLYTVCVATVFGLVPGHRL
ncbi:Bud site selection protein, Revert to axial protein 1 [Dissophora globulifera]|nr:Bud site selection protein, Revert to axial protein 1 [Dissophora globulifera]